jgi:hypothetical protein
MAHVIRFDAMQDLAPAQCPECLTEGTYGFDSDGDELNCSSCGWRFTEAIDENGEAFGLIAF